MQHGVFPTGLDYDRQGPNAAWWRKDLVVDFRFGFATTMLEVTLLWGQGKVNRG